VVIVNDRFEISCASSITPEWRKEGELLLTKIDYNPKLYIVEKAKYSDSGIYECKGYDEENELFNLSAHVYVAGKPFSILLS